MLRRAGSLHSEVGKNSRIAMGNKQNFTPEEWIQVVESVMLSGIAVSAADPSGVWGTLKEGFASSSALKAAKVDANSNELILAAVAEFETSQGRSDIQQALRERFAGAHPAECVARSLTGRRRCRPSSMPRRPTMPSPSRPGYAPLARRWRRHR